MSRLTIVAISDTHGYHDDIAVPDGDILVHAGDLTTHGELEDVDAFDRFLARLPHRHKIVIAGNHDFCFENYPKESRARLRHATYLFDEAATIEGIRFYGSPWQPWFFDWAFNLHRGKALREKWALIPEGTDILITHGPPKDIGDLTFRGYTVGCQDLLDRIHVIKPKVHICGHIHEAAGVREIDGTWYINASIFKDKGGPYVFTWDDGRVSCDQTSRAE